MSAFHAIQSRARSLTVTNKCFRKSYSIVVGSVVLRDNRRELSVGSIFSPVPLPSPCSSLFKCHCSISRGSFVCSPNENGAVCTKNSTFKRLPERVYSRCENFTLRNVPEQTTRQIFFFVLDFIRRWQRQLPPFLVHKANLLLGSRSFVWK